VAGVGLTLLGHTALLRKYAIELRALARRCTPKIAGRLYQIGTQLEADADQPEKVARGNR
jgi:hypothetical protein